MHACLPGSNLTSFNYRLSVTKHILHLTIAITVFMAMTVHQTVLLQALMVSSRDSNSLKVFFQLQTSAIIKHSARELIADVAAQRKTLALPYPGTSIEMHLRSVRWRSVWTFIINKSVTWLRRGTSHQPYSLFTRGIWRGQYRICQHRHWLV